MIRSRPLLLLIACLLLAACTSAEIPTATPSPEPTATVVPTSTPTPEPTPLAYEQIPGLYLGRFHGTNASSLDLDAQIGKGVAIVMHYVGWGATFSENTVARNANLGRLTHTTWEFMGSGVGEGEYESAPLQAILDGEFDDHLLDWAEKTAAYGGPYMLRWGHEMNGDWYPWAGANNGGGTLDGFGDPAVADGPERYVAAYRYIHDIFSEAGADNVLWIWCPNAPFKGMETAYPGWNSAEAYYPGDEYVDWLCMDGYNWGTSSAGQAFGSTWTEFDGIFGSSYERLNALNPSLPIMIGEYASTEKGGDKAAWILNTYDLLATEYPQIRAAIWFHINKETDWRIDSSPESFDAFATAVAPDYFLDQVVEP